MMNRPFDAFPLGDASENLRIEGIVGVGGEGNGFGVRREAGFQRAGDADGAVE